MIDFCHSMKLIGRRNPSINASYVNKQSKRSEACLAENQTLRTEEINEKQNRQEQEAGQPSSYI